MTNEDIIEFFEEALKRRGLDNIYVSIPGEGRLRGLLTLSAMGPRGGVYYNYMTLGKAEARVKQTHYWVTLYSWYPWRAGGKTPIERYEALQEWLGRE